MPNRSARPLSAQCVTVAGLFLLAATVGRPLAAADFPAFETRVIDPMCGNICYAVTLADVDGDGRQDIVAVTENRVLWYGQPEKPDGEWKKHVIIEDQSDRDNVCIAAHDIDGDGKVDFALGAGWTKIGTLQWLTRGKSLDDKWSVHFIDKEVWLHRLRFADVLGKGKPQLVISPLNKTRGDGVRLTAYEIPVNPRSGRWPPTVLDATLNRMHNHWHIDFDGNKSVDTLTASQEGVSVIRRDGDKWSRLPLARGASGEKPEAQGAGEIKTGTFKSGKRLIATVEPMHGEAAVVYIGPRALTADEDATKPAAWKRVLLDDKLKRGHAIWCADLDGDGNDEVIVGHSDPGPGTVKGPGVYVYRCELPSEDKWTKHVLDDGGMATEDIAAADLTGDGAIDIVAGGRNTHNIKLYVNRGAKRSP
ncbi:MAG: VCBS repeat-containing protein [Planctomycetaceae bacterium]|nr:VCBS repeat-containing protein [Planctomycetaceae bacterium]